MYMKNWIDKLDDFLRISERDILTHAGTISHDQAIEKARKEYDKFRQSILEEPSPVEQHFVEAVKETKQLEKRHKSSKSKSKK